MDNLTISTINLYGSMFVSGFLTCRFLILFFGLEHRKKYYWMYISINVLLYYLLLNIEPIQSTYFDFMYNVVIIYLFCRYILKGDHKNAMMMGLLTTSIWVCIDVFDFSLVSILFHVTNFDEIFILISQSIVSLTMLAFAYHIFARRYGMDGNYNGTYIMLFIVPISFLSLALHTIMSIAYSIVRFSEGRMIVTPSLQQNFEILTLSVVAAFCIYIILYTYEKVMTQMEAEQNAIKLEGEQLLQRQYIFEAKTKYDSTQAFRHDFKNHINTLNGLLHKNEIAKAKEYLSRFEEISESIGVAISTNNTIIDILLGEKLALADRMNIRITCNVEIDEKMQIDDFDLCTVFANAVDNAIKACMNVSEDNRFIDIIAKRKNDFFVIDMINSYHPKHYIKGDGIGLETIKLLTEKYGGTMEQEEKNSIFRLSILFTLN